MVVVVVVVVATAVVLLVVAVVAAAKLMMMQSFDYGFAVSWSGERYGSGSVLVSDRQSKSDICAAALSLLPEWPHNGNWLQVPFCFC